MLLKFFANEADVCLCKIYEEMLQFSHAVWAPGTYWARPGANMISLPYISSFVMKMPMSEMSSYLLANTRSSSISLG